MLNSTSSILSYNNFDLEQIFALKKKGKLKARDMHESTFIKQLIYFIIFTFLNFG